VKTESDHLAELIDLLQRASAAATALGFYRNQQGWMKIAALLNEMTSRVRRLATRRAHPN
jgi:hypothetical protein